MNGLIRFKEGFAVVNQPAPNIRGFCTSLSLDIEWPHFGRDLEPLLLKPLEHQLWFGVTASRLEQLPKGGWSLPKH
jgi:hypothetical protein